jgi:hypothetical protein
MSANPEVEEIVALPVPTEAPVETNGHVAEVATFVAPEAVTDIAPQTPPQAAKAKRPRPTWMATAAVGAAALIAAGALGYDAYAVSKQRDGLHAQLVTTSATLASTQDQLSAAQADARSKKLTADYVRMYAADGGKVETDYSNFNACSTFSSCRTSSQQLLLDLQKFQSDRNAITVPSALSTSDASLGDALSAAIAADQEIIDAMDSDNLNRFKDGYHRLDAAMLNVAKAESTLGAELQ